MFIDRIIYPVESLGPGKRLAIWTCGCSKHCYDCTNPELWYQPPEKNMDCFDLYNAISRELEGTAIDGITITGGDPLEQGDELLLLLPLLRKLSDDILVYTGYKYEELCAIFSSDELEKIKKSISVLIDGPYIEELNDGCSLRGSRNQRVIFLDESKKQKYEKVLKESRKIQNVFYDNRMISIGIHNLK